MGLWGTAMKRNKFNFFLIIWMSVFLCLLMMSCAMTPKAVGKWREIGKDATLEFFKDGSFKAVDNQGMVVSGKYTLLKDEKVRFEISHPGSSSEIVTGKLSVRKDELTLSSEEGKEVERYRKVKR
jgi:hypothetical protein